MDIDLLNEFIILSKCLNYSKAADQLYISQSVLSRHIQNLENQLGVELFTRSKHSVALTAIGKIFADDAEKIIAMYQKATEHIQMYKNGALGNLELTTSSVLSSLFIYDFLPTFNKKYPNIKVNVNIKEVDISTKTDIRNQHTDMAILLDWNENEFSEISCIHFFKNNFYAFIPEKHPLYSRDSVTIHELSGIPMVYLSAKENICSVTYFQKLFEKHKSIYNPCITASGTEDIFLKIITENAVSILSEPVFKYTPDKIHPVRISDADAYLNTNLIWNKNTSNKCTHIFAREFSLFSKTYNQFK